MVDQEPGALWARIEELAQAEGIAAIGATTAEPLEPARTVLPLRKAQGLSATMQFTYRNPERSTDPRHSVPTAASIIAAAWPYRRSSGSVEASASGSPLAAVAEYAWRDHYGDLRAALEPIASLLVELGHTARIHLDDNHLVDRNVAYRAGLGWYGKNANLLLPGRGSLFVLGSIITDAEFAPTGPPLTDGCGPCRRCIDDCPTGAIVAPGVVDAGRCIAWLVQGPGDIPVEFREAVGDRIYGCDECQTVCPPNQSQPAGPALEPDGDPAIEVVWLLTADDDELMARVGRWYIAGRDPDIIRRTALVVLGNTGDGTDPHQRALIDHYRQSDNAMLAEHASWAAGALGLGAS